MIISSVIAGIIVVFIVMTLLAKRRNRRSPSEVANIIERFIDGKGSDWEWDDFIFSPIHNPTLEKIGFIACNWIRNLHLQTLERTLTKMAWEFCGNMSDNCGIRPGLDR